MRGEEKGLRVVTTAHGSITLLTMATAALRLKGLNSPTAHGMGKCNAPASQQTHVKSIFEEAGLHHDKPRPGAATPASVTAQTI